MPPCCCCSEAFWLCFGEHTSPEQDLPPQWVLLDSLELYPSSCWASLEARGIRGGWAAERASSLSPPIYCHYIALYLCQQTQDLLPTLIAGDFFFNEPSFKKKIRLTHIHIYIPILIRQDIAYAPSHGNFLVSKDTYRSCNHY